MSISRRKLLRWLTTTGAAVPFRPYQRALAAYLGEEKKMSQDPLRPQFHLLPARNWMNDPNGPIYVNGQYHMFFQYNPQSAIWGNMSWAHAVSPDMVHWKHLPVAFTMTPGSADAAGCFSGSAIAVTERGRQRVYVVYTGVVRNKEHETVRNEGLQESQCLAWSDDPVLLTWHKLDHPILPQPPSGLKTTGFRDPSAWKQGDSYLMTVGSGIGQKGGCVLLYRSKDLHEWEYLHPLTSGTWNGVPTSNPCDDGEMWECPDFFSLDKRHVLIYSTMGKVFWQSGDFDPEALSFVPRKSGVLDFDAFYAPKSQLDAQGSRILWGWIPERRSQQELLAAGWSGMMSLPRLLQLDRDGDLLISFAPQTQLLRGGLLARKTTPTGTLHILPQATGELQSSGTKGKPFEVTIQAGDQKLAPFHYSPQEHVLLADDKRVELKTTDQPSIHCFVDGSVVEILIANRIGYTKRFYHSYKVAPDIRIEINGTGVSTKAWSIKPISPDRLTTTMLSLPQ